MNPVSSSSSMSSPCSKPLSWVIDETRNAGVAANTVADRSAGGCEIDGMIAKSSSPARTMSISMLLGASITAIEALGFCDIRRK
ncbi:hypothetical protein D3C87_1895580 [compost metagenome]